MMALSKSGPKSGSFGRDNVNCILAFCASSLNFDEKDPCLPRYGLLSLIVPTMMQYRGSVGTEGSSLATERIWFRLPVHFPEVGKESDAAYCGSKRSSAFLKGPLKET